MRSLLPRPLIRLLPHPLAHTAAHSLHFLLRNMR
jgi:hypothetical protein